MMVMAVEVVLVVMDGWMVVMVMVKVGGSGG